MRLVDALGVKNRFRMSWQEIVPQLVPDGKSLKGNVVDVGRVSNCEPIAETY